MQQLRLLLLLFVARQQLPFLRLGVLALLARLHLLGTLVRFVLPLPLLRLP